MMQRLTSLLPGLLMSAFVRMRLLTVLIACAVLLIIVRLEKLYNLSEHVLVNSAKAEDKKDPAPSPPPAAAPAPAAEPPAKSAPAAKSEFPKDSKPQEGFSTSSFDILELSPEQVEVLRTLSSRHRDLVQRERSISEREATLQAIENRLDQKTGELKKIQDYLKQLLGEKDEKEKEALKKLVAVYEKMKPAEAANILQGLDLETLLNIMDEMKDTKASAVLAKMEPDRARVLTIELAQRRKKLEEQMKKEAEAEAHAEQPKLTPAAAPVAADPAQAKPDKPAADGASNAGKDKAPAKEDKAPAKADESKASDSKDTKKTASDNAKPDDKAPAPAADQKKA